MRLGDLLETSQAVDNLGDILEPSGDLGLPNIGEEARRALKADDILVEPASPGNPPEGVRPSWWYYANKIYEGVSRLPPFRALAAIPDALEPLYLLEGPRAAYMQFTGEAPGEFTKWLQNVPRAFPGGEKPEPVKSFADSLYERGWPGWAATIVGTLLDAGTDPTVLAFGTEKLSAKLAERVLSNRLPQSVARSIANMTWRDIETIASEIPDEAMRSQLLVASRVRKAAERVTPYGLYDALLPESVRTAMLKSTIRFIDENPLLKREPVRKVWEFFAPKRKTLSDTHPEVFVSPSQAIMTEPTYWKAVTKGTPHEEAVKEVLGHADITSPLTAKGGVKNMARTMGRHIWNAAEATIKDIHAAYRQAIGIAPEDDPVLFNTLDRIVADVVDKMGPALGADLLTKVRGHLSTKTVREFIEQAYPSGKVRERAINVLSKLDERVKRVAKAYDLPEEKVWDFIEESTKSIWGFHAMAGYYLSGMDMFDRVVADAAWKLWNENKDEFLKLGIKSPDEVRSLAYQELFSRLVDKHYAIRKLTYPAPDLRKYLKPKAALPSDTGAIPFEGITRFKTGEEFSKFLKEVLGEQPSVRDLMDIKSFLESQVGSRFRASTGMRAAGYLEKDSTNITALYAYAKSRFYDGQVEHAVNVLKRGIEEAKRQGLDDVADFLQTELDSMLGRKATATAVGEVAPPPTDIRDRLYQAVREAYEQKIAPGAAVSMDDYLKSLYDGYLRRVVPFVGPAGAERLMKVLQNEKYRWYIGKHIAADEVVERIEKEWGEEVADKLASIAFARGDGAISLDELASVIGDDPIKIAKFLEDAGLAPVDLEKFAQELLKSAPKDIAAFAIGKAKWQDRVLPEQKLFEEYLGQIGATSRLEAYGKAAARSISSKQFVNETYSLLKPLGFVKDNWGELSLRGNKIVDEWGVEYMRIPDNPDDWGPLAGKFIPRYAAEPMLRALELNDPNLWEEFVQLWRGIALSAPDTVGRNVGSGLIMMVQAGMKLSQLPKYLAQAVGALRKIREGDLSTLGPGAKYLHIYSEGKLYGEAMDAFEKKLMEGIGAFDGTDPKPLIRKLREIVTSSQYAKVNPLIWFEYSEDLMRTASFLYYRDLFLRAGMDAERAGEKAAAIANHILFNYAEQPYIFNVMKKRGWLLFPAFPYFNLSRTALLAAKRPWAVTTPQYIYEGTRKLIAGNPEEDKRRMRMVAGTYLQNEMPLIFRYGDHYLVIPLSQYIPTAATEPTSIAAEFATGGILRPAIGAVYAIATSQNPPWEQQYGVNYLPDIQDPTFVERLTSATKTALVRAVPGLPKRTMALTQALYEKSLGIDPGVMLDLYGKTGNKSLDEALLNFITSNRIVGPNYALRIKDAKAKRCVYEYSRVESRAKRLLVSGRREEAQRLTSDAMSRMQECLRKVMQWQR